MRFILVILFSLGVIMPQGGWLSQAVAADSCGHCACGGQSCCSSQDNPMDASDPATPGPSHNRRLDREWISQTGDAAVIALVHGLPDLLFWSCETAPDGSRPKYQLFCAYLI